MTLTMTNRRPVFRKLAIGIAALALAAPLFAAEVLPLPTLDENGRMEGERLMTVASAGSAEMQRWGDPIWSGDAQLWWRDGKVGDTLTLRFNVPKQFAGTRRMAFRLTVAVNYAEVRLALNGKPIGSAFQGFRPELDVTTLHIGGVELLEGANTLDVTIVGSHKAATPGKMFGLDYLEVRAVPPLNAHLTPERESDKLTNAPYALNTLSTLRYGETGRMVSSYDRSGGNDDGFKGTYSKLRLENGDSVIAEMRGAGCISRFWTTHTQMNRVNGVIQDGLFLRSGAHVKVYLDGETTPRIDFEAEELFSGEAPGFPKPLVDRGTGGYYCYVPIFFKNGCKVTVGGDNMRFYQLNWTAFDSADRVPASGLHAATGQALAEAMRSSHSSTPGTRDILRTLRAEAGQAVRIELPAGRNRIDEIVMNAGNRRSLLDGRITITWDGAKTSAVDLPISHFYAFAPTTADYRSALTGSDRKHGFYNRMPMPYALGAAMEITFPADTSFTLKVKVSPLPPGGARGYFHTHYAEYLPSRKGAYVEILRESGRGHYLGTFLDTRRDQPYGDNRVPTWLEGDEIFTIDGEMTMHGTGTEDYFNCGWYSVENRLDRPGIYPMHGFTVFSMDTKPAAAAAYRWHIEAPVPFEQNIDLKLEHGLHNTHPADYRTTAFFYLDRP